MAVLIAVGAATSGAPAYLRMMKARAAKAGKPSTPQQQEAHANA